MGARNLASLVRRPSPLVHAAALGALALLGCTSDSTDKAAKKRIFSPEDPPKAVASAKEKIPSDGLGGDAALARRVLQMGAAETTERLGPHRYQATVKFEWAVSGRTGELALTESRTVLAGPGGVGGDFHAQVQNSRDQGLEVIRARGGVYARSRYGKFRERRRDRGMAEREREEVFGALRDFDAMFHGRIQLQDTGVVAHENRPAHRYQASLGPPVELPAAAALPPIPEPKGGVDPFTQARRQFADKREPQELTGWVLVDEETSAVLRAKLDGKIKVPAVSEEQREAVVRLGLDSAVSGVGEDPQIQPPKDFLPDEDKPEGIADALDRFGVPRGAAGVDGGTAPATKPTASSEAADEPDDDAP